MIAFFNVSCYVTKRRSSVSPIHGVSEMVVGVLGGGQLGRMLCQAASEMAIKVIVLDPMKDCPASLLAHHHVVGSYDDSATVEEFGKRFDLHHFCFVGILNLLFLLVSY